MNIVFVISSLSAGGAERVLVNLAGALYRRGAQVTVVTLGGTQADFYTLEEGVGRVALGVSGSSRGTAEAVRNNARRVVALRRTIRKLRPDAVISFMDRTNVLVLAACVGLRIPVIVSERCDPRMFPIGWGWDRMRRLLYPRAAAVVSVSEGVNRYFTWVPENKRRVIYNPVANLSPLPAEVPTLKLDEDKRHLMAMGRLIYQKGFDLLVTSFSRLAAEFPRWRLVIVGDGEKRQEIAAQVAHLGLAGRVILTGRLQNPFPVLAQGDLFVLSSRFEGFPNVLLEAMACGLPVVSFDCPSGPSEIIRDGVDGILVPPGDVDALTVALGRLMGDPDERARLAARAKEVTERFGIEKVVGQWEKLLWEVIR